MQKGDWDKISNQYYDEVLSPIKNCKENLLVEDLSSIRGSKNMNIIDLGCGIGEIEGFLSERFNEVFAIDFSEEMINNAKANNLNLKNVDFEVMDMVDLNKTKKKYDVALSVNSIIMPDADKINKIFKNIYEILKDGGKFLCVLPSMEVYAYQSLIIADKEFKKNKNYTEIKKIVNEEIPKDEHDFLLGITNFDGKQKNYYRFEIFWRLKKAGFDNIQIKKIFYPWKEFEKAGQNYFPKEDLPWDWYVICQK